MNEIRALTAADWRQMGRLRSRQHTHAGVRVERFTTALVSSVDTKYQRAPHAAVGNFHDGQLVAFICAYRHDDFWVLDLMVSDNNPRDLHPCLEALLILYEAQNVRQFYYAFPAKWARAYRSFWKSGCPSLRKYTIEDLCIIGADRIPEPWIWEHVLHETVIPVDLMLRRSYVKPPC